MPNQNSVMFSNLRAEMARKRVTITSIADIIGVNRITASNKLSGKTPITLAEAFTIEKNCFPGSDIRYLFAELLDVQSSA